MFLYLVWLSLCSSLLGIERQWSRGKFAIAHARYIKILPCLGGFRVKIANFSRLHCLTIHVSHFTFTSENEAGVDLVLIQPFLLCYVNHDFLMLTSIF